MKKLSATIAFSVLCAAACFAESLTLDSCLLLAYRNNADILSSRLEIDKAREVKAQVFTKYFPQVSANALSDKYNSKKAGNLDWYFNALAGVRINLGQTHHTEAAKGNAAPQIIHRVDTIYVKQQVPAQAQRAAAPATAAAQASVAPLRRDIFFTIRATQVASQENKDKVKEVADYLKKYPNAKVSVTGYADKGTGNATINTNLSQKRAKVVADILKNQYGIDASRITVDYKGHNEQPFAENDKNRVTICIAQ